MKRIFIYCFIMLCTTKIHAQFNEEFGGSCKECLYLPDSAQRLGNPVLPKEVSMELHLRDNLTNMMQQIADKKGWEIYQLAESASSGFLNADRTGPLVYNLRPPHDYSISFIFIVSRTSLDAWKDWYKNVFVPRAEKLTMQALYADPTLSKKQQAYQDSCNMVFRKAALMRVRIDVNHGYAFIASGDNDKRMVGILKHAQQLVIPHAALALKMHDEEISPSHEIDGFTNYKDIGIILFGQWTKFNNDAWCFPSYTLNKRNIDKITVKTYPSDKVRNIKLHVEGSPEDIDRFVSSLDAAALNNMIVN